MENTTIKENKKIKKTLSKTSSSGSCGKKSKHKRSRDKKKYKKKSKRRSTSSSSSEYEHRKKLKKKKSKRKRSISSSSSLSPSIEEPKIKKSKSTENEVEKDKDKIKDEFSNADVPIDLMEKSKAMAPMTKEEWEKRQSVVRRVYDEASGRHRLVKGDGEIIEEIVSRDRHKAINKSATLGDGTYFQTQISKSIK